MNSKRNWLLIFVWSKQICRQYQQSVGLNKAGVSTCFSLSQSKNLVMVETCWNSAWQTGWTVSLQGCSNSYQSFHCRKLWKPSHIKPHQLHVLHGQPWGPIEYAAVEPKKKWRKCGGNWRKVSSITADHIEFMTHMQLRLSSPVASAQVTSFSAPR